MTSPSDEKTSRRAINKRNVNMFLDYMTGSSLNDIQKKYNFSKSHLLVILARFKFFLGYPKERQTFFLKNYKKHQEWRAKIKKTFLD